MSRPLRIQYRDALYHVMNRGRPGEKIFVKHLRGDKLKDVEEFFGISKNSTISSIYRRLKGEMIRNKQLNKTVEKLKHTLIKGHE